MKNEKYTLWTVTAAYAATGEGLTVMARISYAEDEASARQQFEKAFDPFFASGCTIEKGVVRNEVTRLLWSEQALTYFEQFGPTGSFEATSSFHSNHS